MALSEQMPGDTGPNSGDEMTPPGDTTPPAVGDVIELTVPALSTYLGVVRTATAGLAARLAFSFDEIEDLRIAVDEACVMVLSLPAPTPADLATLTCRFHVLPDALAVKVSARVGATAVMPVEQSFAWQVLTAHATHVSGGIEAGLASVGLRKPRKL